MESELICINKEWNNENVEVINKILLICKEKSKDKICKNWMNLENIIWIDVIQAQKTNSDYCFFYEHPWCEFLNLCV